MKLSTKGRYAITAMLDLALNASDNNRVTLADISEFQGISLSYLEQLFARLRQTNLVKGTRGPGGGYRLAKPANEITISEIIAAVDDKSSKNEKLMKIDERHRKTQQLWQALSSDINLFLSNITLGDLVSGKTQSSAIFDKQEQPTKHLNVWHDSSTSNSRASI